MASQFSQGFRLRAALKEKECWIPVLLSILYCFPVLFLGETFFYRDIYRHTLPQKHRLVEMIKSGQLPLWDPYLYGGQPLLGNVDNVVLHPSNLFYLLFPLLTALNLVIVVHMALGGIAVYLLCRALKFEPSAALAGSLIFTFCGYSLSLIQFSGHQTAWPLLSLMLLFWHLYLSDGELKWFAVTSFCGAIQIFSGAPEINLVTFVLLLGWTFTNSYSRNRYKNLKSIIGLYVCIAGLAAIQILPTLEMLHYSARSLLGYADFTVWSVHPKRFPELLFAQFMGRTDALSPASYWGSNLEGFPYTYILSFYFGAFALALVIAGLSKRSDAEKLPFRTKMFFAVMIAVGLILCMGKHLPGFNFLYSYVPLLHWFRYPVKFLALLILPVTLLAASGFETLYAQRRVTHKVLALFGGFAVLLALFALCFLLFDDFANAVQQFFFGVTAAEVRDGLQHSFQRAAVLAMVAAALLLIARKRPEIAWLHWPAVIVLALDLFLPGLSLNPTAPKERFSQAPPIARFIKSQIGDQRLYRDEVPSTYRLRAPSNDVLWQNVWDLQILNYYTAVFYDIPLIFHKDQNAMTQQSEVRLKNAMDSLPWQRRLPLLSAGAVSLLLTDQAIATPGIKLIGRLQNASNLPFYLYRNETASPRISIGNQAIRVGNHEDAMTEMMRPGFDPRKTVVLEQTEKESSTGACSSAKIVGVQAETATTMVTVETPCAAYVVFSEAMFPGWRATVDGKTAPLLRANYMFSAVAVPAGRHNVIKKYRPLPVYFGALISLLFGGGIILQSARAKSRDRQQPVTRFVS